MGWWTIQETIQANPQSKSTWNLGVSLFSRHRETICRSWPILTSKISFSILFTNAVVFEIQKSFSKFNLPQIIFINAVKCSTLIQQFFLIIIVKRLTYFYETVFLRLHGKMGSNKNFVEVVRVEGCGDADEILTFIEFHLLCWWLRSHNLFLIKRKVIWLLSTDLVLCLFNFS